MKAVVDASVLVVALIALGPEDQWTESVLAEASDTFCCFMTRP